MTFEDTAHSGKNRPAYEEEMEDWLNDYTGSTKIRSIDDLIRVWSASIFVSRLTKGGKNRLELAIEFTKKFFTPYIYEPNAFVHKDDFDKEVQIKEEKIYHQKTELAKLNRKLKLQHEVWSFTEILQLFIRKCRFTFFNKFKQNE